MRKNLIRKPRSHKGDYGHALVLAGSRGMTGAALLASEAALRAGAGRVTLGAPREVYPIAARRILEVMTLPLPQTPKGSLSLAAWKPVRKFLEKCNAAAVGPGLSTHPSTRAFVRTLVLQARTSLVIDADGINALAGAAPLLKKAWAPPIVTPHEGEFARLSGIGKNRISSNRKGIAKRFSTQYHCILVLKGSRTLVAEPGGKVYENRTGNAGMATAGTGDVLTGMIAGLLAQGFEPFYAACLAVYAHGRAGDLAAQKKGQTSLIASDLLGQLPAVFKRLEKSRSLRFS